MQMASKEQFVEDIQSGYTFKRDYIDLGAGVLDGQVYSEAPVRLPLRTLNRHGLISGATGTGKTKTLQIIAEQLSLKGIPSLVMDIKGDLSGIAVPGESNEKIEERHVQIGFPFEAGGSPVEFLSLSDEPGLRLRATVSEFGPVLFSKMLDLTEVQSTIMAVLFKYCDDHKLPLVDLDDVRQVLNYFTGEGKEEIQAEYGRMSSASTGAIMRRLVELEQQGADRFFGEPSFAVEDLVRTNSDGKGMVSIVRLTDIQDRPKLFSTFMLQLLAEVYATFPEEGDLDQPKLVLFIDEAHLIFEEATDALMDQIEMIVKLIRSKGVGLFFITQNPVDIPAPVLGQLGLKVQHALRAFTAKDRKAIKLAAENFPLSDYYDVDDVLTQLGIGEALVTTLGEKGIPTPLVYTLLRAPQSRMDVLSPKEIDDIIQRSKLQERYDKDLDRESAKEILKKKLEEAQGEDHQKKIRGQVKKAAREKSTLEKILSNPTTRQIGNTVARELTRGLLGVLGLKKR